MFSFICSTSNINVDNELPNITYFFFLPNNAYFSLGDVFNELSALKGKWSVGLNGICGEFFHNFSTFSTQLIFPTAVNTLIGT